MSSRSTVSTGLLMAGLAVALPLAADPLQQACQGSLFRRTEGDPQQRPLPPVQKLEALVNKNSFRIKDLRKNETFVFQVLAANPATGAPALKDLGEDLPDDGKTLVAPVDLTGSGVADLVYARERSNGWKVLSNGARLPKPCQAFVAGYFEKNQEAPRSEIIPADTSDLVVDNDLLAVVGDFLGNGTEQLAYTRPGWTQVHVVGAHGVTQMAADLRGIEANGPGHRVHWLFPFKATGAKHTRIAYYRMGSDQLATFAPQGMAFKRAQAPLKGNWEKLDQIALDWPQKAPSQLEQKVEQARDAVSQATGMGL
jgi:hypothetical protein